MPPLNKIMGKPKCISLTAIKLFPSNSFAVSLIIKGAKNQAKIIKTAATTSVIFIRLVASEPNRRNSSQDSSAFQNVSDWCAK